MSSDFIHLHSHTEYSLDIGFISIDDYVKYCYYNKAFAAVLTERFNLFSFVKFYEKCFEFGIKPIIGCEILLEKFLYTPSKIIILCKNRLGYENLTKLLTKAYLENAIDDLPIIKRDWLFTLSKGLIIIGLSFESDIGMCLLNKDYKNAIKCIGYWKKALGNSYYLSITKFGTYTELLFVNRLLDILTNYSIQLVATNEVCFLRYSDFFTYKSKIAIFDIEKKLIVNDEYSFFENKYFKSTQEMFALFSDMPALVSNTAEIAKRCNLHFKTGKDYSPKYKKMNDLSMATTLIRISFENLFEQIGGYSSYMWPVYLERLSLELRIINRIGFANYFLVTHDFIVWAKNHDIYVGPGRGSGAGSLVAYSLAITDIDPLQYDLLFERFLNHERISIPDFDVDLCIENRDLVIDYVFDEYGTENVAQIITFGCMTINAVVRDVGRVLGYSYMFVDKVVKFISADFGISLKHEVTSNYILRREYNQSYDVQLIINTSLKLEGIIKGIGRHAGGLVISSIKLPGYLPLSYEEDDYHFMTQLDKVDAEKLGFIKFDFLGLKTLSILSATIETLLSYKSLEKTYFFNQALLSLYNNRTYALLQSGDTVGIFQLESAGIKSVIQRLKPDLFSDIVALVALYRPGPLQSGMLHSFLARKLGSEKIDYIHPRLKDVLKETYGMVVYQEQVMLIAQVFAGYSVSAADFLRIAMSKKNPQEMQLHLQTFALGASRFGIDPDTSENVFYIVEKFAGYGFNKAHSVGYALLAYNSAWLKANYNIMFLSSLLSSDMYNYENVALYINECVHYGIRVFTPDINRGFYCFTMGNDYIHYGLGSINGVGLSVISEILDNRSNFGPYHCFFDFLYRMDIELLSKKTLELLIYSGVFNKLYAQKFKLALIGIKFLDLYYDLEKIGTYITTDFIDKYFNYFIKKKNYLLTYKQIENRAERDILPDCILTEFIDDYNNDNKLISNLSFKSGKYINFFITGIIKKIIIKKTTHEKYVSLNILCFDKYIDILISYSRYYSLKNIIKKNNFIVALCYEYNKLTYDLLIDDFYLFRYKFLSYIDITLHNGYISNTFLKKLAIIILSKSMRGNTLIRFKINIDGTYRCIHFNNNFKVTVHDEFLTLMSKIKEITNIEINYSF